MALMTRREFIRGVVGAGSMTALSATSSKAPAQPRGVTLRALIYPYPITKALRDMLREYERQTGVRVEWEEAPYAELLSKQMAELIAATDRYDFVTPNNLWLGTEAATGQLLPLDDLIAKAGATLDWADFIPEQRKMFSYKGKQYGIPLSANIQMVAYRKDVFDQEGITVPPLGTSYTHDQWLGIVRRLTKGKQKGTSFQLNPIATNTQQWSNVLMSAGGRLFDERLTPIFNSKEGLLAAEYLRELMNFAPADFLRSGPIETNEAMMSGEAMTVTAQFASRIPMVEDKEKSKVAGKVRWTTLPYAGWVPDRKVGLAVNDGWGISIPKASKHQREAFDFAVWCVMKDKQHKFVIDTLVPPTRTSVFGNPELHQKFVWLPVMGVQLRNAFDLPPIPETSEITEKVGAELHAGYAGQYPLRKALERANDLVTQLLKERNYPVGTWKGAKLPWE